MTTGTVTKLACLGMETSPTRTGDAAFDEAWVLDGELRAELVALRSQVRWMGVAGLEATRSGLLFRWPGELSVEFAAALRDLTLRVADRLARTSAVA